MKAVTAAVCVLLAVLCLVTVNALWIRKTVADIRRVAEAMPDEASPDAEAGAALLKDMIDRHEALMGLSVSYTLMDKVRELAVSAGAFAQAGDTAAYRSARAVLLEAVDDLDRLERLDVRNLM